eukprot:TRINITY_DN965_c2_g1_i1.p1 TRINITY_DN965_c2_g1~~TRINITY_DN965_c2_g1_i1.p1  ORF type:complete len:464 (+),score=129.66 TRINITY_DN965_c2_g1_i1:82-1392(+)
MSTEEVKSDEVPATPMDTDEGSAASPAAIENDTVAAAEGDVIDVDGNGGCVKRVIKAGVGYERPPGECNVNVHYVGTLEKDGSQFDSSRDRGEPFSFKLGTGQVIKGWDAGVATMHKGEISMFTIRSDYGYGDAGHAPKIPGKATLCFEVELLDWEDYDDISKERDGRIMKKKVKSGEGWDTPNEGSTITVNYRLWAEADPETTLEEKEKFQFRSDHEETTAGLERAVHSMNTGERSLFKVKSVMAYGEEGNGDIAPNTDVVYEVTLIDFVKAKEAWEMSKPEKIEAASATKLEGNACVKKANYALALKRYEKAVTYVTQSDFACDEGEEKDSVDEIVVSIRLNEALCQLKLVDYKAALTSCDEVLKLRPTNVKALYRSGQAHVGLAQWKEAVEVLDRAKEIDEHNRDVLLLWRKAEVALRKQDRKEKTMFKKMFA